MNFNMNPKELHNLQFYLVLAFIYWDNREYADLLDPLLFWEYAPIISVIKSNHTMETIIAEWIKNWCMGDVLDANYDMNIAFQYRHHMCWQALLQLWEEVMDDKIKNSKKKLSHEAVQKLDEMYKKLKERLAGKTQDSLLEESMKYVKMAQEKNGVRTGLDWLDSSIGWLRSGTVTRLNWYSNVGKSRFMYRVIVNVLKQGKSIHLFSLEVPKWMVLINLVSTFYEVDSNSVEQGKHNKYIEDFYEKYGTKCLIEDDKISLEDIQTSIVKNDKDCIFIDYVQNIRAKWKDEYEKMTTIAQDIQKMAIMTCKPFFDLSQVSNEGTRYKVWDMIPSKGTGAFVHACDVWLVLYKWDDIPWKQIKLAVAKNKFGNKDIEFVLHADFSCCKFTKLSDNLI